MNHEIYTFYEHEKRNTQMIFNHIVIYENISNLQIVTCPIIISGNILQIRKQFKKLTLNTFSLL